MSAPHQNEDSKLEFRRWEVSVWQYLLKTGPCTTEELWLSRLIEEEDLEKTLLSGRLATMRRRGMLTNSGKKCSPWHAVPTFSAQAYLYSAELTRQAIMREDIYAYLVDHGPAQATEIHQVLGSWLTRCGLIHFLEAMERRDMLTSTMEENRRMYRANPSFDMRAYMESIPQPPQPESEQPEPAQPEPAPLGGLRLEAYIPPPEPEPAPEQPTEFVGPRFCPPAKPRPQPSGQP